VKLGLSYREKGILWGVIGNRVLRKMFGYKMRVRKNKNVPSLHS
jgi:hypothetical protein